MIALTSIPTLWLVCRPYRLIVILFLLHRNEGLSKRLHPLSQPPEKSQ